MSHAAPAAGLREGARKQRHRQYAAEAVYSVIRRWHGVMVVRHGTRMAATGSTNVIKACCS